MLSWLSCREYAQKASRELDGDLSLFDRVGFLFHHVLCMACRRYRSQIQLIDKIACHLDEKVYEEVTPGSSDSSEKLSTEARERIKRAIDAQQ